MKPDLGVPADPVNPPWSLIYGGPLADAVRSRLESGAAPLLAEFYISDRCALRCKHCYHGEVHSKTPGLTLTEWRSTVRQFVEMGTRRLHFAGREPFLSPTLLPVLRSLAAHEDRSRLSIGAITDGFSCAPLAGALQDAALDYLEVSLDGLRADHDRLRGRGTYDRTVRAIDVLMSSLPGVCFSVASVLSPENAPNMAGFVEDLRARGVYRFFFQPIQALGWARDMALLTPSEFRRTVHGLRHELESGRLAGRGLVVMIFFPVEYLPAAVAGDDWLEARLTECLRLGRSAVALGGNRLILNFEITRAPFTDEAIVSHDGYLLARCGFRSVGDYDLLAPGNVRSASVRDLLTKARTTTLASMPPMVLPGFGGRELTILQ